MILHSDCNCFYASVEMLHHPELAGRPLAVGGDPAARHGIVLTANYIAKRRGVQTGMALWQARQACPDVVFVPPRMDLYIRFSRMARAIYRSYSDQVESYGLDECWIDITRTCAVQGDHTVTFRNALTVAEEIRARIRRELGITVSIGISWNKIYAKLGSDYRKPDAITVFDRDNYQQLIYPLPASDLLYVGSRTARRLRQFGIGTIGQLAQADPVFLQTVFGKVGLMLSMFARGLDETPVAEEDDEVPVKSIGNSTTTPRDLTSEEDVRLVLYLLAESVASRLRDHHVVGQLIGLCVRDNELYSVSRQHRIATPTNISGEIEQEAMRLFREIYTWNRPIRSLGVRVGTLHPEDMPYQMDLFHDEAYRQRQLQADIAADDIRRRFGFGAIQRGIMYQDRYLSSLDAKADDHMIHPHSYLERGNHTGCERLAERGVGTAV